MIVKGAGRYVQNTNVSVSVKTVAGLTYANSDTYIKKITVKKGSSSSIIYEKTRSSSWISSKTFTVKMTLNTTVEVEAQTVYRTSPSFSATDIPFDCQVDENYNPFSYNVESTKIASPSVNIYPNPTTGYIHANAPDLDKIEIYNVSGNLVGTFHNEGTINISHLASGTYILKLFTENGVEQKKIIKR